MVREDEIEVGRREGGERARGLRSLPNRQGSHDDTVQRTK